MPNLATALRLVVPATLAMVTAGCRRAPAPAQSLSDGPFTSPMQFHVDSHPTDKHLRFFLRSVDGPVTITSIGGVQRGTNLGIVLITPADVTLEPGTRSATLTVIGDSGLLAVTGSRCGNSIGESIEYFSCGVRGGQRRLPASFATDQSLP